MTHYEAKLERDRSEIQARVVAVSGRIEKALHDAVRAVVTHDRELAAATILGDLPINREIRDIDRTAHAFVARHLPSAGHLRFISSVLRLNVAIERVGDYAVAVAREAVQLSQKPPETVIRDLEMLSDQNCRMFAQAMKAFDEGNADLARGTMGLSGQLASTFENVFADLLDTGEQGRRSIKDLFALLVIYNRLGRVGDQAKNVCEETVFWITGETKRPKVYRVLFVDESNDGASLLVEGYARKAFAESGHFESAGWSPAEMVRQEYRDYMKQKGYDLDALKPLELQVQHEYLNDFHVVVGLGRGLAERIPEIPFHTVLLEWDLEKELGKSPSPEDVKNWAAKNVGELMTLLRGEGAC